MDLLAVKRRMAIHGVFHLMDAHLDGRSITAFQAAGVFTHDPDGSPSVPDDVVAIIASADHPARLPRPMGPLVAWRSTPADEGFPQSHMFADVSEFLLSDKLSVRSAAWRYLNELPDEPERLLTPRTRAALQAQRNALESTDATRWRTAAVTLYDAVGDDWLSNLAALRQCLASGYNDDFDKYLQRVFHPSMTAIDSIDVRWWHPQDQRQDMEKAIADIAGKVLDLSSVLTAYHYSFGHLPLEGPLSVSGLVTRWLQSGRHTREEGQTFWNTVWSWAERTGTALARYHACFLFLNAPDLIPVTEMPDLWRRVVENIGPWQTSESEEGAAASAERQRAQDPWRLAYKLATHYCRHLEYHIPTVDGEAAAVLAWWMSERVALTLRHRLELIHALLDSVIRAEAELSHRLWQFAHPSTGPSVFRYTTVNTDTVWSLGLVTSIPLALAHTGSIPSETQDRERLYTLLTDVGRINLFATPDEKASSPDLSEIGVYAFSRPVAPVLDAWNTFFPPSLPQEAPLLEEVNKDSTEIDTLDDVDLISRFVQASPLNQTRIAEVLHARVYTGRSQSDRVFSHLEDQTQRNDLLLGGDPEAVGLLINALLQIQVIWRNERPGQLPHILAATAEEAARREDTTRRRLLFNWVMLSSMTIDTVSAVRRLLLGEQRHAFVEDVSNWNFFIEQARDWAPPWLAGRLRAYAAELRTH